MSRALYATRAAQHFRLALASRRPCMDVGGTGMCGYRPEQRQAGIVPAIDQEMACSASAKPRLPFMPTPRKKHFRPFVPISVAVHHKEKGNASHVSQQQPLTNSFVLNEAEHKSDHDSPIISSCLPEEASTHTQLYPTTISSPSKQDVPSDLMGHGVPSSQHKNCSSLSSRSPLRNAKPLVRPSPTLMTRPCAESHRPATSMTNWKDEHHSSILAEQSVESSNKPNLQNRSVSPLRVVRMEPFSQPHAQAQARTQSVPFALSKSVSTPSPASASRTVRAKVTEGIRTSKAKSSGLTPTESDRLTCSPERPQQQLRIPDPPSPSSRIDVSTLQHELGDNSFVLESDDTHPSGESVQVHIRVRPNAEDEQCAWVTSSESASLALDSALACGRMQPNADKPYYFDDVHTGSSNAHIYSALARPLVHSALHGYNAVIFAYGQTASGKTFTLSGDEDGREPGVIPRAVQDIFNGICQGSTRREYLIRVSYLEIWNEIVRDLLEPANQPQVRDDRRRGPNAVLVAPLHEEVVTSPAHVFKLLARGESNRHTGATDWNERSSRSHTCFKITIESWDRNPANTRPYRISELSLIDLAGSERHSVNTKPRRTEGGNINKSLLSLGKVIFALSEKGAGGRGGHIPYRESKLTRILQNNLNGRSRIAVVCTLNPSPAMVEESLSTLNFARRIKHVRVRAPINEYEGHVSLQGESQTLLAQYREEMGSLRAQVAELQSKKPSSRQPSTQSIPVTVETLHARLEELGALILQGGAEPPAQGTSHPVSPTKQRGFAFDDPLPVLQEKLHAALEKIRRLERQLAARMSLPMSTNASDDVKDARIQFLLQQIRELETVCEAQTLEAPQKMREDVEAEWMKRLEAAEAANKERDAFLAEISAECTRLRQANEALVRLAHEQTSSMLQELASRDTRPHVISMFMPHLRPTTVLGTQHIPAAEQDLSIDDVSSDDRLSSSELDDLLDSE